MDWVNTVVQGVLVGGLYGLFAAGLSLIFGVMRLVNIAHGDLVVLAAYVALVVTGGLGLDPLASLVLVVPIMAAIGYAAQRLLLNRTLGGDLLPPLLVTFGLSVIIQNGLLMLFSADSRRLQAGPVEVASWRIADGLSVGVLPLAQFAVAVVVIGGLQLLFYRTALGRAFRAVSDDPAVARLMGLDTRHIFGLAMALSLAVVAIAGVFLAVRGNFDPSIGPNRLIYGFEAVIIGGLGSLWGTLAGGIILGVVQATGAQIDPGWQVLAGHLAFLAVLAMRPRGLFARQARRRRHERIRYPRHARQPDRPGRTGRGARGAGRRPRRGRGGRVAAAGGVLRLRRAGQPVEPAGGVCRAGLGGPAGIRRPRRLHAVRHGDPRRRQPAGRGAGRRPDRGAGRGSRGGAAVPVARRLFRHRLLGGGQGHSVLPVGPEPASSSGNDSNVVTPANRGFSL